MSTASKAAGGVWHEGEVQVQTRAGVREEAEQMTAMYRREIPAGMAGFLAQQQLAVLSTRDREQRVWANLIAGAPGMLEVKALDALALVASKIDTRLPLDDIQADAKVGLLAIDLGRRIRVRINGNGRMEADGSIILEIEQLYGNCSQYIQKRVVDGSVKVAHNYGVTTTTALSASQRELIEKADTFFIASRHPELGADASHRGGMPGFVRVTSLTRISFPDYSGNNMFNTLGNIAVNPAVGLLFVDFESGRTLQVSGRASVDWDRERSSAMDEKAQRVIDVDIVAVREIEHSTSLRFRFIGYSPTLG